MVVKLAANTVGVLVKKLAELTDSELVGMTDSNLASNWVDWKGKMKAE